MSPVSPFATDDTQLITKLQDVRDHLSQELQHLTAQVERKTLQLRGIESILEDATGAATNGKATVSEAPAIAPVADPVPSPEPQPESVMPVPEAATPEAVPTPEAAIVPAARKPRRAKTPTAEKLPSPEKSLAKAAKSKPPTPAKPPAKSKPPTAKTKQSALKSEPSAAKPTDLRHALQPQFQGKTLAGAIGEVLAKATEPMTAKDVAIELYEGLTIDDLKRAVKTVATLLATGRTKGNWQSPGKGLYQGGETEERSPLVSEALTGAA